MLHLPCSVKVEFLPTSVATGLTPFNSALKALELSRKRVVQFGMLPQFRYPSLLTVLTPTFLPDIVPAIASRSSRYNNSIEDLFDLFPSPPAYLPPTISTSAGNVDSRVFSPSPSKRAPSMYEDVFSATESSVSSAEMPHGSEGTGGIPVQAIPTQIFEYHGLPTHEETEAYPMTGTTCKIEKSIPSVCLSVIDVDDFSFSVNPSKASVSSNLHSGDGSCFTHSVAKSNPGLNRNLELDRTTETKMEVDPSISPVTKIAIGAALCDASFIKIEHLGWRRSMENAIQAFRYAKAGDQDFRDLFYRETQHVDTCPTISPMKPGSSEGSKLRIGDSATSSCESIFEDGLCTPDSVPASTMQVVDLPNSIYGIYDSSDRVGLGVRDFVQVDATKNLLAQHQWISLDAQTRNVKGMDCSTSASSSDGDYSSWIRKTLDSLPQHC